MPITSVGIFPSNAKGGLTDILLLFLSANGISAVILRYWIRNSSHFLIYRTSFCRPSKNDTAFLPLSVSLYLAWIGRVWMTLLSTRLRSCKSRRDLASILLLLLLFPFSINLSSSWKRASLCSCKKNNNAISLVLKNCSHFTYGTHRVALIETWLLALLLGVLLRHFY